MPGKLQYTVIYLAISLTQSQHEHEHEQILRLQRTIYHDLHKSTVMMKDSFGLCFSCF